MKKLTLSTVFLGIVIISLVTMGFRKTFVPGHKYVLTQTEENWNMILGAVDSARTLLLNSDIPAKQAVSIASKLGELEQAMQVQIGQQIQADTVVKTKK